MSNFLSIKGNRKEEEEEEEGTKRRKNGKTEEIWMVQNSKVEENNL